MTVLDSPPGTALDWGNDVIRLRLEGGSDGPVRLVGITSSAGAASSSSGRPPSQPLVEVLSPAYGRSNNSYRYEATLLGSRLRLTGTERSTVEAGSSAGEVERLEITQEDEQSGLVATTVFEARRGVPAVRTATTVRLRPGSDPLPLWAVTSFATGAVVSDSPSDIDLWHADTAWSAENRWVSAPLRSPGLVRTDATARGETSRNRLSVTSIGSWSSGVANPAGAAQNRATGETLAWQIEHNGAWTFELGESPAWAAGGVPLADRLRSDVPFGPPRGDHSQDAAYVAVLGPTDTLHQWSVTLRGDESFETVPVSFTTAPSLDDAFGNLARQRRATRREHPQNETLPVIFNDYMNTLEGDPTEGKLLPLIDAAASVGAEYFCIDAGWYDDTAGWWASVGDWKPSTLRFPSGLASVLDRIRERGMVPGLWLEPEVVGVTSTAASTLPDSAFLQRDGVRIREHERFLLDLRSPPPARTSTRPSIASSPSTASASSSSTTTSRPEQAPTSTPRPSAPGSSSTTAPSSPG